MLIRCPALSVVRTTYINELKQCIKFLLEPGEWTGHICNLNNLVKLIVDCHKLIPDVLSCNIEMLNIIENKARFVVQATSEKVILVLFCVLSTRLFLVLI